MLGNVEILWVVEVLVEAVLDSVDYSGLEVDQKSARNIVLIISLIEEDVFPVSSLSRILLQVTLGVDAVFLTKTLPELVSNYKIMLIGRF